jgi:hypothetical protein
MGDAKQDTSRPPENWSVSAVLRGHTDLRAAADQTDAHGRKLDLGDRPGRPPVPAIYVQALQDELRDYLMAAQSEGRKPKQDPECLDEVCARIKAWGWETRIHRSSALRKIVQPVHRAVWPD